MAKGHLGKLWSLKYCPQSNPCTLWHYSWCVWCCFGQWLHDTPCFAFCLWLAVCPCSSLTFRIQLITNVILNACWDCTFSGLGRIEDCEQDSGQDRLGFWGVAAEGHGLGRLWRRWLLVPLWSIRALLGMGGGTRLVEMMQDFCFIVGLMS